MNFLPGVSNDFVRRFGLIDPDGLSSESRLIRNMWEDLEARLERIEKLLGGVMPVPPTTVYEQPGAARRQS